MDYVIFWLNDRIAPALGLTPSVYTFMPTAYFFLLISATIAYFLVASLSFFVFYYLWGEKFNPQFKWTQRDWENIKVEIRFSMWSAPIMAVLETPLVTLDAYGFTRSYHNVSDYGWWYIPVSFALFLIFTDMCIYWIHRWLHTFPLLYKYIHKVHHKFTDPTPFAAIAFHPVDGVLQASPYHLFLFFFPMHKIFFACAFGFVQLWTVAIHDQTYLSTDGIVNGAAHHLIHHKQFLYNYGQYFTFWDRLCGTHKDPTYNKGEKMKLANVPAGSSGYILLGPGDENEAGDAASSLQNPDEESEADDGAVKAKQSSRGSVRKRGVAAKSH